MFHIFWVVFCIGLGKALAVYFYSFTSFTSWTAIIVTAVICMIPGFYLSWYLYWAGRFICVPISNWLFKNPVAPKKRLIDGITIRACYALAILTLVAVPIYVFLPPETLDAYFYWIALAFLGVWMVLTHGIKHHPGLFVVIAKLTRDFPREDFRRAQRGDGGDSQFAGFWKEWDYPWISGIVLLGQSLYGKHWVGYKDVLKNESDDRHMITMAGSRAGKGISRIIPNLLLWPDNAIIIDPKGENAFVTAHNPIRSQAYIIDPYGMVKNVYPRGEDPSSSKTPPIRAKYNPLQDIDPYSPTAIERIKVVLEAVVYSQSAANKQWERTPKTIIGSVIGHVLTDTEIEDRSFVTVYNLLNGSDEELHQLVLRMRENHAMGRFIPNGANALEMAIRESRQSFKSAVVASLEWISYPKIQELIGGQSDFSIFDIANKPLNIYLCFDIEKLEQQSQFVRLFFLMAFHAMTNPRDGIKTKKVLFLMDEFFTLGYLPMLERGAQYIAGDGVKFWPIIQNISMIESLYGKTWTNFIEAAGVIEVFGLKAGDKNGTAFWVHEKLGASRSANLKLGDAAKSMDTLVLMTQSELEQEFRREDDRMITFISGADPIVLRRKPYWDLFHPNMYEEPPQGVPLNVMQRKIMEKTGWTHTRYFGSNSATLKAMGTPFDEPRRIQEINPSTENSQPNPTTSSVPEVHAKTYEETSVPANFFDNAGPWDETGDHVSYDCALPFPKKDYFLVAGPPVTTPFVPLPIPACPKKPAAEMPRNTPEYREALTQRYRWACFVAGCVSIGCYPENDMQGFIWKVEESGKWGTWEPGYKMPWSWEDSSHPWHRIKAICKDVWRENKQYTRPDQKGKYAWCHLFLDLPLDSTLTESDITAALLAKRRADGTVHRHFLDAANFILAKKGYAHIIPLNVFTDEYNDTCESHLRTWEPAPPYVPTPYLPCPHDIDAKIVWAADVLYVDPHQHYTLGEIFTFAYSVRDGEDPRRGNVHAATKLAFEILATHRSHSDYRGKTPAPWHDFARAHKILNIPLQPLCTYGRLKRAMHRLKDENGHHSKLITKAEQTLFQFLYAAERKGQPLPVHPKPGEHLDPVPSEIELYWTHKTFDPALPYSLQFKRQFDEIMAKTSTKPKRAKKHKKDKSKKKKETLKKVKKSKGKKPQPEFASAKDSASTEKQEFAGMTVPHARKVFDYAEDEIPTRNDLKRRYKKFLKLGLDEVIQQEVDEAYAVLLKIAV